MAGIQIDGVNNKIDFDDDLDTSISANTDDTLVFEIAGATDFTMTANDFTALSGSVISTDNINETTSGSGVTIDGVLLKDGNITMSGLAAGSGITLDLAGSDNYIIEESSTNDIIDFGQGGANTKFSHNISSGALTIRGASTITTADNTDTLTLKSTDADENIGPVLRAKRVSSSAADNDELFNLILTASNDAQEDTDFAKIKYLIKDASNGTEDAQIDMQVMQAGSLRSRMKSDNAETVFNEDSVDLDFRVESNGNTHMLFVDGGNNAVGIGNTGTLDGVLHIKGAGDTYVVLEAGATDGNTAFFFHNSGGTRKGFITYDTDDNFLSIGTADTERMRIDSAGTVGLGTGTTDGHRLRITYGVYNKAGIYYTQTASDDASNHIVLQSTRSGVGSFNFLNCLSNNGGDNEFIVTGDGDVFSDGAYDGSGADYAEYFEWKDGNSSNEDRRGYSVVLDGNQIVKATESDDTSKIIGVISANPAVVGDSAWNKWNQKHLRDDFGTYILEDYTVTEWVEVVEDGNDIEHSYATDEIPDGVTAPSDATVITNEEDKYGNTVNLKRRKTNPDWNKDTAYIPRADRKEWDTVGLMGKLRLKKGQPTGTNWIKMRDISDTVEEWLVR